ncbi:unnamed protein product [Mytilus coruscus]|uniref:Uncharacterized protein n=1 Tax=Mytilus coruscus TaxID=42192 RepID=A0A6J8C7A4_MYTCO|nr:unnamed protein product [Mytilus coruscus]
MVEKVLRSYDPFAYRVNNVSDLDVGVVRAYKDKDKSSLNYKLSFAEKSAYKVYICVNNSYHAFILCTRYYSDTTMSDTLQDVTRIELCFEDEKARMYKIRRKVEAFVNIKDNIKKAYSIGIFHDVSEVAFQCAALQASPNVYSVLLDDCVEFSKRFCKELLTYASNGNVIRTDVEKEISNATASGFNAEKLSREIQSSGYWMNSFLGGSDFSTFVASRKGQLFAVILIIVYPIVVTLLMSR